MKGSSFKSVCHMFDSSLRKKNLGWIIESTHKDFKSVKKKTRITFFWSGSFVRREKSWMQSK